MSEKTGFFHVPHLSRVLGLSLALLAAGVQAGAPEVRPDHPESYTVVKGDTLWDIAGRFLKKPWLWPDIWQGNPQIEDPHLIYPGDVIALVWVDGKPVLTVNGEGGAPGKTAEQRYTRLSPQVRVVEEDRAAIPPIPLDVIHHFLAHPKLLPMGTLGDFPYVVDNSARVVYATVGDTLYVRGLPDNARPGDRYSVYTSGAEYKSPSSGELFGHEAIHVADVVLKETGDPAAAVVTSAEREIQVGDRLLAPDRFQHADTFFVPRPFPDEVDGHIISSFAESPIVLKYHIVVLDLGADQGVKSGDVFSIHERGRLAGDVIAAREGRGYSEEGQHITELQALDIGYDVTLPDRRIGALMVFRVLDRISYAIVMESRYPIQLLAKVRKP